MKFGLLGFIKIMLEYFLSYRKFVYLFYKVCDLFDLIYLDYLYLFG